MRTIQPDCECLLKKREQAANYARKQLSSRLPFFHLLLFSCSFSIAASSGISCASGTKREGKKKRGRKKERSSTRLASKSWFVTAEWRIIVMPESGAPPTPAIDIARGGHFFTFYSRPSHYRPPRCFLAETRRKLSGRLRGAGGETR